MPRGRTKGASNPKLQACNESRAAADSPRGICVMCSTRPVIQSYTNKIGKIRWRKHCSACATRIAKSRCEKSGKAFNRFGKKAYTKNKKTYCEGCGFKANTPNQLHVDHIDGNHKNDSSNNLWTLCANCHAEKTWHFDVIGAI